MDLKSTLNKIKKFQKLFNGFLNFKFTFFVPDHSQFSLQKNFCEFFRKLFN